MVEHDNSRERRSVGYVRVSSGNSPSEAQEGIAAQKQAILEWARREGLRNVGWYVDGEPGSEDSDDEDESFRPALRRLLADARFPNSNFRTLLVWKLSRLSRTIAEFREVASKLRECGVTVVSIMESDEPTPAEGIIQDIIRTMDEYQRDLHSEDTRRGIAAARRRRQDC